MGGRFYHEATEWVSCRMSGNNNAVPAWSIGATFTRDVTDVIFFHNNTAIKNQKDFTGTFRDTIFTDSNNIKFYDSGRGQIDFIDCTTFSTDSGDAHQFKSVNYVTTDSDGSALEDVCVRINAANDSSPTPVISNASGVVPEILAEFQEANTNFGPFRIRIRKYGFQWASLNSPISDAIKQSVALNVDNNVTQSESTALAHSEITIADTSPVSWNGKTFRITVTANSSNNLNDVKHYLHAVLGRNNAIGGKSGGLLWHNLIPMALTETQRGNYGGTQKGVRVIDENNNPFPGIIRMQADDGTYYVPPVSVTLSISINQTDCDVVILEAGTQTVLASVDEQSGNVFNYTYTTLQNVDIGVIKQGFVVNYTYGFSLPAVNATLPIKLIADRNYL
jgi:hypothetical protein